MTFLKAEWRKLAILNYIVDEKLLEQYLPAGTVLDLLNDKCYISLVGLMSLDTELLGVKVPFHTNYEEVNFRFYVRRLENSVWKRGVVFIKETVPKRALTFVANTIYNESFETNAMSHSWSADDDSRTIQYSWKKKNRYNSITVKASLEKYEIEPYSETHFITEHYFGYAKVDNSITKEYGVFRPPWNVYMVQSYQVDVAFGEVYGDDFEFLNALEPISVILVEGSKIELKNKRIIS